VAGDAESLAGSLDGLGVRLTLGIVQHCGGQIQVWSRVNEGVRFTIPLYTARFQ
jgi:hypothetical protein